MALMSFDVTRTTIRCVFVDRPTQWRRDASITLAGGSPQSVYRNCPVRGDVLLTYDNTREIPSSLVSLI
jgi:hypothetical protein